MRFKLRDRIRVKRAVLKSPVREIRTQGSVRGQLGNWLFYLDYFDKLSRTAPFHASILLRIRNDSSARTN